MARILEQEIVRTKIKIGNTPLHEVARSGNLENAEILIAHDANPSEKNLRGYTPLHTAADSGSFESARILVIHGSDLNATTKEGNTPLHLACYKEKVEMAKMFILHGADPKVPNKEGETPLFVANREKHKAVPALLKEVINSDVPPEVYLLSSTDSETFGNILKAGFYKSHVGKILIIGHEAVGKTAISNVLVGKVPSKIRQSTEGIEVHIYKAAIDLKNRKWIPKELDIGDIAYRNLMVTHKFTKNEVSILETLDENDDGGGENSQIVEDEENDNKDVKTEKPQLQPIQRFFRKLKIVDAFKKRSNKESPPVELRLRKKLTNEMLLEESIRRSSKVMVDMDLVPVNMMDFGGQYIFYSTHQSFLTYRGLYILPVNGSLDFDAEIATESFIPGRFGRPTSRGFVLFWVGSISTCSVGGSEEYPKIFVLLTHRDKIKTEIEANERAKYIFGEIRKMFENTKAMPHLILEPELFINAMDPTDPDYRKLESTIVDNIFNHPTWGEKLPKAWIPLQLALQQNVQKGDKVMSMEAFRKVNEENPVHVLTERELQVFLKMFHTQGEIIFFPLQGLRDKIILSPSFFVECLRSLVTERAFCTGKRLKILASINREGVLRFEDIDSLWERDKEKELFIHKKHLISVMVHLDILAAPRKYNKAGNLVQEEYFFVPSLVKTSGEGLYTINTEKSIGLSLKFHSNVIPPAIGYRLIASCIDMYELKNNKGRAMLFSGMAVLVVKRNMDLIVVLRGDRVDIYLEHEKARSEIVADTAVGIAECIKDILSRILDSFKIISSVVIPNTESEAFMVEYPCLNIKSPCYNATKCDWTCHCGHIISEEIYSKWTIDRKTEICDVNCMGIGNQSLCEKPSELQLAKLALQFAWDGSLGLKDLLIQLGLRDAEIRAIEVDNLYNNLNTRFLCLRKWRLKTDGTIMDICKALNSTGYEPHLLCRMYRDRNLLFPEEKLHRKTPSDKDLDAISAEVIDESLLLAVHLEVPASKWQEMKADNCKIVKINREVLGEWRREAKGKNKMQELAQALCNIGISITSILQDL